MTTEGSPHEVLFENPVVAKSYRDLAEYFRAESSLPAPLRELAILCTANSWGSKYVWDKHLARAGASGLSPELISAVYRKEMNADATSCEHVVLVVCIALQTQPALSDLQWHEAVTTLGRSAAIDLVAIALLYRTVIAFAGLHGFQEA